MHLEHCHVRVDVDGVATASYRWSGNTTNGTVTHDEDVSTWTDEEIRDAIADLIGVEDEGDKAVIEVCWI